ncbi:MAG: hypothetical protein CME17_06480 [Gemmatimonadetes bacterium]|nr:hypothetical protein [Gemmatimonadota bacterium]|tara:strand:- start:25 stop:297 length:273 start_codon:yes stop_codon:yes gene_type:complete
MNQDLYDLSNAFQAFVNFGNNLKRAALYGYKIAADQDNPEAYTLLQKLEQLHLKERNDLLSMAKEGQRYITILVNELESQIKFDEGQHGK